MAEKAEIDLEFAHTALTLIDDRKIARLKRLTKLQREHREVQKELYDSRDTQAAASNSLNVMLTGTEDLDLDHQRIMWLIYDAAVKISHDTEKWVDPHFAQTR